MKKRLHRKLGAVARRRLSGSRAAARRSSLRPGEILPKDWPRGIRETAPRDWPQKYPNCRDGGWCLVQRNQRPHYIKNHRPICGAPGFYYGTCTPGFIGPVCPACHDKLFADRRLVMSDNGKLATARLVKSHRSHKSHSSHRSHLSRADIDEAQRRELIRRRFFLLGQVVAINAELEQIAADIDARATTAQASTRH